jgi:hypothetical protein
MYLCNESSLEFADVAVLVTLNLEHPLASNEVCCDGLVCIAPCAGLDERLEFTADGCEPFSAI